MDVAASEFYTEDKMYDLDFKTADNDGSQKKTSAQMQDMYKSFVENYPVVSIEDPYDQVRTLQRHVHAVLRNGLVAAPICISHLPKQGTL